MERAEKGKALTRSRGKGYGKGADSRELERESVGKEQGQRTSFPPHEIQKTQRKQYNYTFRYNFNVNIEYYDLLQDEENRRKS